MSEADKKELVANLQKFFLHFSEVDPMDKACIQDNISFYYFSKLLFLYYKYSFWCFISEIPVKDIALITSPKSDYWKKLTDNLDGFYDEFVLSFKGSQLNNKADSPAYKIWNSEECDEIKREIFTQSDSLIKNALPCGFKEACKIVREEPSIDLRTELWEKIFERWIKVESVEREKLENRILQHGRRTTNEKWYKTNNTVSGYNDWIQIVSSQINNEYEEQKSLLNEYIHHPSNESKERVEKVISNALLKYRERQCLEFLSVEMVVSVFLGVVADEYNFDICDFLKIELDNSDLKIRLFDYELRGIHNDMSFIAQKKQEELFKKLGSSETYKVGEGISGSILMGCDDELKGFFHVGTNDNRDPRQSTVHNSAYKELYSGRLNDPNYSFENYWEFPIRDERGLIFAVFRVVNHREEKSALEKDSNPISKLDLVSRAELVILSNWFSKVLLFCINLFNEPPMLREDFMWQYYFFSDKQNQNAYDNGSNEHGQNDQFNCDIWNDFIPISNTDIRYESDLINTLCVVAGRKIRSKKRYIGEKIFKDILEHLIITSSMKNEHRSLGCTIYVVDFEKKESILTKIDKGLESFYKPDIENGEETEFSFDEVGKKFYKKYTQDTAVFIYVPDEETATCSFKGVYRLIFRENERGSFLSPFQARKSLTKDFNLKAPKGQNTGMCFSLDGDRKTIKIFFDGEEKYICYLSQSLGKWKIRDIDKTIKDCFDIVRNEKLEFIDERAIRKYFSILIQMSSLHEGAIVVFTNEEENQEKELNYGKISVKLEHVEDYDTDRPILQEMISYLSLDGALITTKDRAYMAGYIIKKSDDKLHKKYTDYLKENEDYKTLNILNTRGSRHNTAAYYSYEKQTLVLVVSENGGITAFVKGRCVLEDW